MEQRRGFKNTDEKAKCKNPRKIIVFRAVLLMLWTGLWARNMVIPWVLEKKKGRISDPILHLLSNNLNVRPSSITHTHVISLREEVLGNLGCHL